MNRHKAVIDQLIIWANTEAIKFGTNTIHFRELIEKIENLKRAYGIDNIKDD